MPQGSGGKQERIRGVVLAMGQGEQKRGPDDSTHRAEILGDSHSHIAAEDELFVEWRQNHGAGEDEDPEVDSRQVASVAIPCSRRGDEAGYSSTFTARRAQRSRASE